MVSLSSSRLFLWAVVCIMATKVRKLGAVHSIPMISGPQSYRSASLSQVSVGTERVTNILDIEGRRPGIADRNANLIGYL